LRTVTVTASTRGISRTPVATAPASASSRRKRRDLHHPRVVDRLLEVVGACGVIELRLEVEVELERLGGVLLARQCPVVPEHPQAPQLDATGHR
jgi:hypothetical protein